MTHESDMVQPQPKPNKTKRIPVWFSAILLYDRLVVEHRFKSNIIELMNARNAFGKNKHGVFLTAFNGRNAIVDCIQESLDKIAYLVQYLEEQRETKVGLNSEKENTIKELIYKEFDSLEQLYLLSLDEEA